MSSPSPTRTSASRCAAFLAWATLLLDRSALAADHPCDSADSSLACRLTGVLHWLTAAAWILAVVLVVVIAIAVHLYRKNRAAKPERH